MFTLAYLTSVVDENLAQSEIWRAAFPVQLAAQHLVKVL